MEKRLECKVGTNESELGKRRRPSAGQGQRPQRSANLPMCRSQISSIQNRGEVNVCCFSRQSVVFCYGSPSKLIHHFILVLCYSPKEIFFSEGKQKQKPFQTMMRSAPSLSLQTVSEMSRGAVGLLIACDGAQNEVSIPGDCKHESGPSKRSPGW